MMYVVVADLRTGLRAQRVDAPPVYEDLRVIVNVVVPDLIVPGYRGGRIALRPVTIPGRIYAPPAPTDGDPAVGQVVKLVVLYQRTIGVPNPDAGVVEILGAHLRDVIVLDDIVFH